jgi:hypothetical protein
VRSRVNSVSMPIVFASAAAAAKPPSAAASRISSVVPAAAGRASGLCVESMR